MTNNLFFSTSLMLPLFLCTPWISKNYSPSLSIPFFISLDYHHHSLMPFFISRLPSCSLPTESAMRVWDCLFLDGFPILMSVGLATIKVISSYRYCSIGRRIYCQIFISPFFFFLFCEWTIIYILNPQYPRIGSASLVCEERKRLKIPYTDLPLMYSKFLFLS